MCLVLWFAEAVSSELFCSPFSSSMEPENVISYGLSLTHNCLRVHKAADLIEFYSQKFGMKLLGELTSQDGEQFFYLGFSDYPGSSEG
jgi:hypothetical protein